MTAAMARTGRPASGEYADYAMADIAAVPGDDAVEALTRLAEDTAALFLPLGEGAVRGLTYAPGKWTLKEVLGHLIDDERIFAHRILCVARGEAGELPGFDENRYAAHAGFESRSLDDLLAEYVAVRAATLALLRTLSPAAWRRRGRVNGYSASVRGLAFHIAGHELHHHRVVRERYLPLLGREPAGQGLQRRDEHHRAVEWGKAAAADLPRIAEQMRAELIRAARAAYEDARVRGLCAEGAWEVAVAALRQLDLARVPPAPSAPPQA